VDPIAETAMLINSTIDNHIGTLESCSILQLIESSASGDVLGWMKKLRQKGVMKVSMEVEIRDDHHTIIPFDVFTSFKELELKNYFIIFKLKPCPNHHQVLKTLTLNNVRVYSDNFQEILPHCVSLENLTLKQCQFIGSESFDVKIDSLSLKYFKIFDMSVHKILVYAANIEVIEIGSIFCNPEDLVFETPRLLVLHVHNDVKKREKRFTTRDIIEIFGGILVSLSFHLYYISVIPFIVFICKHRKMSSKKIENYILVFDLTQESIV
jgi:hypothetical protein